MKLRRELAGLAWPVALAAALLLIGCTARKSSYPLAETPGPVYDTAEQVRGMPPCKAVVMQRAPCYLFLRTPDGKGFYLGSPGSDAEVGHFLDVLKDGRTYRFPETFFKYQKQRRDSGAAAVFPRRD
jgi:hypothetical protein